MKKLLKKILRALASAILRKYNPDVIAITGSVGKTSTKEAIFIVLEQKFNVRKNIKNYNNEIGIPLTIIGKESGGKSLFRWLSVGFAGLRLILFKDKKYPQILILELGADHPGDIKYLASFVKPKIGIITAVAPVHTEFFKNLESVAKEKGELIKALPKDGLAILNNDDKLVAEMASLTKAKILTFGFGANSGVGASEIKNNTGINFKIRYQGNVLPVTLENIIASHLIYSVLPAFAVGARYNLNLIEIAAALKKYKSPPGRMNLISGIKKTQIIDDTYNSSPQAAAAALKVLTGLKVPPGSRRYAVLGDMLELGGLSEPAHREIGALVAELNIDVLITVGELSRDIAKNAKTAGMSEDLIFSFAATSEAGKFLQSRIGDGDIILIKGSQGMRMEKIVKEIMADPQFANELLVRQGKEWT